MINNLESKHPPSDAEGNNEALFGWNSALNYARENPLRNVEISSKLIIDAAHELSRLQAGNEQLERERDELIEQVNSLQRSIGRMKDDHAGDRIEQQIKALEDFRSEFCVRRLLRRNTNDQ